MATAKTKFMVYQAIKDNLERRFKTLQKQKGNPYDFNLAENAYFKYIGENIIARRLTREFMLEGRLHPPATKELFNVFISINTTLSAPAFWNEKLENKFGFEKELKEMMESARKEYTALISKRGKSKISDKNLTNNEVETGINELINEKHALRILPIIRQLQDDLMERLDEEMILIESSSKSNSADTDKAYPKSIHLVTKSIVLDYAIFLVIDEQFDMPERFSTVNDEGNPTYITKLYNIAYMADVPDKKVKYSKRLADDINNGLFRHRKIASYLKSNGLKKPTLVKKSEDDKILVLNNDTPVKDILIHEVPTQFRYLYLDKTS